MFFAELRYKTLSLSKLSTTLLDQAYTKIKIAVTLQLCASYSLNLVINESTNISRHRIINTFAITNNSNCFYILNIKLETSKLKAKELAKQAVFIAKKITNKD